MKVLVGGAQLGLDATQYCENGAGHRYSVRPPVVTALPGTRITFTVPEGARPAEFEVYVGFDRGTPGAG